MALSDTKIRSLSAKSRAYQVADNGGLVIEVLPTGRKVWRLRYRFNGKSQKATLGEYPAFSLAEARLWREKCRSLIAHGVSPAQKKQEEKTKQKEPTTVEAFSKRWLTDIIEKTTRQPRNVVRVINKDIIPVIGRIQLEELTTAHVQAVIDRIKLRGSDHVALLTRNVLKRMLAYAISRGIIFNNPAAAIEARYIAQATSRDVALTPEEIGILLRGIYTSGMNRRHKLALHLLILCMVRKSELIEATWDEINFVTTEWRIPAERMKMDNPHIVPLSGQALAMFEELKFLAGDSPYVFPSRNDHRHSISKTTLNAAVRTLNLNVRDFVIHDFRRTASTLLHEQGYNSDWVEKCLAHKISGVRGVYNRAEYLGQRREMLQAWADFVDAQIEEGRKVIIGRFGKAYKADTDNTDNTDS
ncbi:tyrosine-type recombinase/integrase [Pectobacterium actinidiae]|uniref:tyrosine-type recombinase/integrase n=1 Tax=Pectobacterium actinidiae TaxID=1507808 RepID=UPI002A825C8C|nr:integrase arm-type DNA-binding domain-containing protein [Pectobacterium actinidiae]MDY4317012.1 tyrosine-type recombinase/integrase [Pectobacterium actinidiae]